jgi:hypothetical protein
MASPSYTGQDDFIPRDAAGNPLPRPGEPGYQPVNMSQGLNALGAMYGGPGGANDAYGPGQGPGSTGATASGGSPYDAQINQLYAGIGKTPDMIDQQGRDFWTSQLAAGNDITGAFQQSAAQTYANMLNGQSSPYQAQNIAGYNNLTGQQSTAQVQQSMPYTGGGTAGAQQHDGFYSSPGASMTANYGTANPATLNSYTQNPYLQQMGQGLQTQFNNNLTMNTLPSLRGGAVAAGGVGGSRQGIAEGLAAAQSNVGADNAITNLYGQDYGNQMNRNLQQYQGDQQFNLGQAGIGLQAANQANQYDLGRRGVDLGYLSANNNYNLGMGGLANQRYGMNQNYQLGLGGLNLQNQGQQLNFYTSQRGQDQTGLALGASLYGQGVDGPWNPINNMNGAISPYTGNGTTTASQGGGATGAIGGALTGAALGKQLGWWG